MRVDSHQRRLLKSAFSFSETELFGREDGQFREAGVNPSLESRPRLMRPIHEARPQAGQRYALFKNAPGILSMARPLHSTACPPSFMKICAMF